MRPLRPATRPTPTYPRHRRLTLRRAGVAITVLLVGVATGCGTADESMPQSDTGYADTTIAAERVEHRVPETGEAYYDFTSYHVVLQVPSDQLDAVQRDEALIFSAAQAVLPTDCMDWEEGDLDAEALEAFVDALPAAWQIGVDNATIHYLCEMPLAGAPEEGW